MLGILKIISIITWAIVGIYLWTLIIGGISYIVATKEEEKESKMTDAELDEKYGYKNDK